jgi:hypothetical protein
VKRFLVLITLLSLSVFAEGTNVVVGGGGGGGGGSSTVTPASEAITVGATITAPTKGATSVDLVYYYVNDGILTAHYQYHQTGAGSSGSGVYTFDLPNSYQVHADWLDGESQYRDTIGVGMASNSSTAQSSTTAVARASLVSRTAFSITVWTSASGLNSMSNAFLHMGAANLTITITVQVPIVI